MNILTGVGVGALELVLRRIRSAERKRSRRKWSTAEEDLQDVRGIGDVDCSVVVGIGAIVTGKLRRGSDKEREEHPERVGQVQVPAAVGVAAEKERVHGENRQRSDQVRVFVDVNDRVQATKRRCRI